MENTFSFPSLYWKYPTPCDPGFLCVLYCCLFRLEVQKPVPGSFVCALTCTHFIIDDPLHHPVVSHPGNNKFPSQLPLSVGEAGVCRPQLWTSLMPLADILEGEQLVTFFILIFKTKKREGEMINSVANSSVR